MRDQGDQSSQESVGLVRRRVFRSLCRPVPKGSVRAMSAAERLRYKSVRVASKRRNSGGTARRASRIAVFGVFFLKFSKTERI